MALPVQLRSISALGSNQSINHSVYITQPSGGLQLVDGHWDICFVGFDHGQIMRIGATRRRRMPIKVMMLTFTPAAQAEIKGHWYEVEQEQRNTRSR